MVNNKEKHDAPLSSLQKDLFLSSDGLRYGTSGFTFNVNDYLELFDSFCLADCGFGRDYFEDDPHTWCYWTFNINYKPVKIYTKSFTGKDYYTPTFIIDFYEYSTHSTIQILYENQPIEVQEKFSHLLNFPAHEKEILDNFFRNYLFTAFSQRFLVSFNREFSLDSIVFLGKEDNKWQFLCQFSVDSVDYFVLHLHSLTGQNFFSFDRQPPCQSTQPLELFSEKFVKSLRQDGYLINDLSTPFLFNLTESLMTLSIVNFFKSTKEFQVRKIFQSDFCPI